MYEVGYWAIAEFPRGPRTYTHKLIVLFLPEYLISPSEDLLCYIARDHHPLQVLCNCSHLTLFKGYGVFDVEIAMTAHESRAETAEAQR